MGGRLYVFPLELLNMWQRAHGPLAAPLQEEFVRRPICLEIGAYPAERVASAVRRNKKLTAVLDELTAQDEHRRSPELDRSPGKPPQPGRRTPPVVPTPPTPERPRRPLSRGEKWLEADKRLESPSDAERILWERLRNRRLDGFFFLREFAIQSWWADFYCAAGKLVVEVDGKHHLDRVDQDAIRDRAMRDAGYKVMRVPARRIYRELDHVLVEIRARLNTKKALAHRNAYLKSATAKSPKRRATTRRAARQYHCPKCLKVITRAPSQHVVCPTCLGPCDPFA